MHSLLLKFADDTKGARKIESILDAAQLQKDLDNLFTWSNEWNLLFNFDKCHILHLGKNNPCFDYSMGGITLKCVQEEKDLGVVISSCCTPSRQVSLASMKANQVLGQLLRAVSYRNHIFIKLYVQYVRHHLEYCVQAWNPWLRCDIELLENVQRRAVRAVSGLSGSYEEKLQILNLPSLEQRRKRGDMIETYKLVHGLENMDAKKFFTLASANRSYCTRRSTVITDDKAVPSLDLLKKSFKLDIRKNFFSQRVINDWNALPWTVKSAESVNQFKNRYDSL